MYGFLNKDNLIPDGENSFILKHNSNYFSLIWICKEGNCWLQNDGRCKKKIILKRVGEKRVPMSTEESYQKLTGFTLSCFDLYDLSSIYNTNNR